MLLQHLLKTQQIACGNSW